MRNTPAPYPIPQRGSEVLIEELCLELRSIGCAYLPDAQSEWFRAHIENVKAIYGELSHRGVDVTPRLEVLSKETDWQTLPLLHDCLAYPERIPYVKGNDGVRIALRCGLSYAAERPIDAKLFWFCSDCMQKVVDAIRSRTPFKGLVLFRTYNLDKACKHANPDTVLATEDNYEDMSGYCEQCITDEIERRRTLPHE
jgi:hypothetical protein